MLKDHLIICYRLSDRQLANFDKFVIMNQNAHWERETMIILRIVTALGLLTLGRKVFWLFVAGIGFTSAIMLAGEFLRGRPDYIVILLALAVGLLGALIAIFVQRLAVGLAGFLAGGYFLSNFAGIIGAEAGQWTWILFLVGGIIGAIFVASMFDWALIFLSSLAGATLLVRSLPFEAYFQLVSFGLALAVGVLFQSRWMRKEQTEPHY
jgi:hypothetical protein